MDTYLTAFRHFPQAVLLVSPRLEIVDLNLAASDLFLAGDSDPSRMSGLQEDIRDWIGGELLQFQAGDKQADLFEKKRRDGFGAKYYRIRLSKTDPQSRDSGLVLIFSEITERLKYLQELVFLATIVESSDDAVIGMATDGKVVSWNRAAERIYGYPAREILGRDVAVLVPPGRRKEFFAYMARVAAGEPLTRLETIRVRKDGGPVHVSLTVSSIRGETGEVMGISCIARDITQRKKAERALRRAKEDAEAASAAKSRFLANISHELRTPLSGIIGMTSLVLGTPLRPDQEELLLLSLRSARDLLGVVNDLLELAAIDSGRTPLRPKPFCLEEFFASVAGMFAVQARAKGLTFDLDIPRDLPTLAEGDPVRLKQVLINLLGNALKFTAEGGMSLTVSLRPPMAGTVGLRETLLGLRIRVSDTGPGIEPELREVVFESFTVGENFLTKRQAGAGLGLAICKRLVEAMGGVIDLESTPGQGSRFTVDLDLVVPPAGSQAAARDPRRETPQSPDADLAGLVVLVVEDEVVNRMVTVKTLKRMGLETVEAQNGVEALDRLARAPVDVVLMDIQMPVMDGIEATRRIRAGTLPGQGKDVPIIALTAHAMPSDRQKILDAGMDGYVAKPFEAWDLCEAIRLVLNQKDRGRPRERQGSGDS
ncbi:PAS domain-containing hybrid sensor histidine kinase/response regulator [Desulfolutivibrio sulfoxidireducens]|uniref:PAS domain-containing hybrid sensor histidine kinase/response regulator n=1 Tax=Desulfolutivibrio sulfoxidireducens TaxID=2773299 RepID=UPI00159D3178|nr:PAS domain-containing hybrid sensor histidine kinase/response regulator [Desulfolutivibrio sulfoxidireducens]QLA14748.1 PAS domain S-box protein [Desulfolutivibrio sulfoxidireducens]QLA18330.1 PAS domain S-box protein [Desulfolutivibrio sulfoxidireducens]